MNLDPAPRQPKLVYLAIDAGLLITAFLIVAFARDPYAPLPFVSAVLCVVLAAIIGLVPFITDYAADSAEYVQSERARVAEQTQRLQAAIESLGRSAAQIKAVEEAVHKTAHAAENLPYRMQEKLAEFNEALATKENDERESLEREIEELRAANTDNLKTLADKLAQGAAEWSAVEAGARKQVAAVQAAADKLGAQVAAALAQLDARLAALEQAAKSPPVVSATRTAPAAPVAPSRESPPEPTPAPASTPPPPAAVEPAPVPVVETPAPPPAAPAPVGEVIASVTPDEPAAPVAPVAEEPKPKKPRPPRKPKPEELLATMSAEPAPAAEAAAPVGTAAEPAGGEDMLPLVEEAPAKAESSASSDGATRLLVTAYIGIGNKLFIRGDGPGLSWDKGVPMQFVSIGKWGWATHDATGPVRCKLYKNDDTPALSGEITLEPGKHVESTALF